MAVARNSVYSMLGTAIPLGITIVTLPIFIRTIGTERYGAIALCWLILTYVGRADFGISQAATRRIAMLGADNGDGQAAAAHTAFLLGAIMAVVLGLITYAGSLAYFSGPFELSGSLREELVRSCWLIGLCTVTAALSATIYGCIAGREMFGVTATSSLLINSGSQILPLLSALFVSQSVEALLMATLAARLLGAVPAVIRYWKVFHRGRQFIPNRAEVHELINFGKWIMVLTIARPLMLMADRIVIGAQLGAIAVTAYTVPYQIASRLQLIPQAVLVVLFPRFAALDHEQSQKMAANYLVMFANVFSPLIVGGICLAEPLLRLWLGSALDERSILLARIMLAGFWITGMNGVANNFILARGNSRFVALLRLIELPAYFGMMYYAADWFGLAGVAAVFSLVQLLDLCVLAHKMEFSLGTITRKVWPSAAGILLAVLLHNQLDDWIPSLAAAFVLASIAAINAYFTTPPEDREKLLAIIKLFRGRMR